MISRNTKNVLVVSFGFLFLFTAYGGLQSLQSSLNAEEGMGVISLSVIYGTIILSSMFLPPIMIKNLGCKWTIFICMACYISYSFGNLFPGWPSLIATSAILGLGGSPLWSAKCTYLTITGNRQAEKENKKGQDVINQYFGMFFLIFQSSAVWGNLMSSLIFQQDASVAEIPEDRLQFCGAALCNENFTTTGNFTRPEQNLVNILMGCYIGVGVLAMFLVAVFLDNIDGEEAKNFRKNIGSQNFCTTFLATFRLLRDKRLLMLIPLTMYSGFEQSFLAGEYTKNYVTCALGIHYVGFVMICFGAVNSLSSYLFGKLAQYTGRITLFCLALYGTLFPDHKEAAFANYRMWESLGFVIAFAYSTYICLSTKLYILIAVLMLNMLTYFWVEYNEYKHPTAALKHSTDKLDEMNLKDTDTEKYQKIIFQTRI
ncbi:protein unc-93 homolog A isoform X1 [Tachysurus ichikawai]